MYWQSVCTLKFGFYGMEVKCAVGIPLVNLSVLPRKHILLTIQINNRNLIQFTNTERGNKKNITK